MIGAKAPVGPADRDRGHARSLLVLGERRICIPLYPISYIPIPQSPNRSNRAMTVMSIHSSSIPYSLAPGCFSHVINSLPFLGILCVGEP